ncbi:MAG: RidA family protein [Fibrobacterota bacterium]|nr:RidA family protein [Fibrobacterota bacterium]
MESIETRLESLGIRIPTTPKALGSYVPAVRTGNLVYIAGQLPIHEGQLIHKGKVGRDLDVEKAQEAAGLCFVNALAALSYAGVSPDKVTRVIRLGGFVNCPDGFTDQSKVVNGASDLCVAIFGEAGRHSRAAVGVNALPMDAPVEIEVLFEVAD